MDNIIKFEKKLKEYYNNYLFLSNNEEEEIPDDKINKITENILNYSRLKILKKIKSEIQVEIIKRLTFGKLLKTLREKSKLSYETISNLLKRQPEFIMELENNNINPISLSEIIVSHILNIYNVTIKEFIETSRNYFMILNRENKKILSRYTGDQTQKSKDISSAIDSALIEIDKKENIYQDIDDRYIDSIKKELIQLKRIDLL